MEGRPHDDAAWGHYLRWYLPRTRVHVLSTPQELPRRAPDVTDSYPTQRDQGASLAHDVVRQIQAEAMACSRASLTMAPQQHMAAYDKIAELCRRVTRSLSCRDDDVAFPLQPPMFRAPAPTPPPARPAPAQTTPMTYPPPGTQYGTHAGPSTRPPPYYQDAFAAGTSSRPPPYYQDPFAAGSSRARPIDWGYGAGTTPEDSYGAAQAAPSPQGVAEQMAQSLFASPTQEELGYSQLHDAPPRATRRSEDREAVHDSPPPRRLHILHKQQMAAPAGRGRGRGRRGNPPHHFVWEGSFGPEEYEPPLEQFPLEGIHTFVGARRLRPYDDRREEWPKCAHGEHCVVQVFDSWIDGGRRFYRCPNGYDYYDMGNCRFAKWVDPPNHQHIEEYISYLKDRIHELEGKVKSLEEDEDKKTPLVHQPNDWKKPAGL
ncbi:hypothetical protein U9M48_023409 [Paspalum notatum var. saurae]|uniref:GRF-type domain-containing protein n=1 Tax=Paspalum notatum var. saurae TaxID=547442 RepID=A0AAQ3TLJ4_PASNO